jgi:hypothetical protein
MSDPSAPPLLVEGAVGQVDLINREVALCVGGRRVVFDVPPDCRIVLRGDRVRLRVVQLRDRARVTYTVCRGRPVARSIDVQADRPLSPARPTSDPSPT